MRQLSCTAPGVVEWCEVPAPTLVEPTDALVRPIAVSSVTVASSDDTVLALAEHIGADPLPTDFGDRPKTTRPIVVDCGVEPTGLQWAVRATEPEGVLHSVSSYAAEATVPMPLRRLYTLGIEFHIGRAHSAALLPEVVALVASDRLHPELVTTSVIDWAEAPERFLEQTVKLVVTRPAGV